MSERSRSSGVQGLRAMFEQSNETTSPPSRGRSPAGSIASDGSRPYSKVRTSFISVDPSTPRKMSSSEGNAGGGELTRQDSTAGVPTMKSSSAETPKLPKLNGNVDRPTSSDKVSRSRPVTPKNSNAPNENEDHIPGSEKNEPVDVPAANPDKPVTGAEEDPASILPADPKEEAAVSGGTALKDEGPDLGSVLKGSPFGAGPEPIETAPESKKTLVPAEESSPSKPAKSEEASKVNGHTTKSSPITKVKTLTSRSSTTSTKKEPASGTSPTSPKTSMDGSSDSVSKEPSARKSHDRRSVEDKPRSNGEDKATKAPAQASTTKAGEPAKPYQSSLKTNARPSNKTGPTSPLTSKPRPKSPTRPVRLPASATAPTASSAAKLGGAPPSRSPSRASITGGHRTSTANKTRPTPLTSATAQSRQKPARSSLPPQPVPKPKPRASMASAKGGDSFLARMMRPTESSRSKTHEKVEAKSPPSKTAMPKRNSGGAEESEKETAQPPNGQPAEVEGHEQPIDAHKVGAKEAQGIEEPREAGTDGTNGTASESAEPVQ